MTAAVEQGLTPDIPLRNIVESNLTELGGGAVNRVYHYDGIGVIHIGNKVLSKDPSISLLVNRWSYDRKAEKLANIQNNFPNDADIQVPKITLIGEYLLRGETYPLWIEDYLQKPSGEVILEQANEGDNRIKVSAWIANFHTVKAPLGRSLREYYIERLLAINDLVTRVELRKALGSELSEKIHASCDVYIDNICDIVMPEDQAHVIHGDLRAGNIIALKDKTGIIDFEQGVMGGDPLADIFKLTKLNKYIQSLNNPSDHHIRLDANSMQIIAQYVDSMGNHIDSALSSINDGGINSENVQRRLVLLELDNLFSMFAYNYYTTVEKEEDKIDVRPLTTRLTSFYRKLSN